MGTADPGKLQAGGLGPALRAHTNRGLAGVIKRGAGVAWYTMRGRWAVEATGGPAQHRALLPSPAGRPRGRVRPLVAMREACRPRRAAWGQLRSPRKLPRMSPHILSQFYPMEGHSRSARELFMPTHDLSTLHLLLPKAGSMGSKPLSSHGSGPSCHLCPVPSAESAEPPLQRSPERFSEILRAGSQSRKLWAACAGGPGRWCWRGTGDGTPK